MTSEEKGIMGMLIDISIILKDILAELQKREK